MTGINSFASIFTTALFEAMIGIKSSASIFTAVLFEAMIEIESLARIFTTVLFEVMIEIDSQLVYHLRKPRVLTPLRSLRKEQSGVSTLGLRRC